VSDARQAGNEIELFLSREVFGCGCCRFDRQGGPGMAVAWTVFMHIPRGPRRTCRIPKLRCARPGRLRRSRDSDPRRNASAPRPFAGIKRGNAGRIYIHPALRNTWSHVLSEGAPVRDMSISLSPRCFANAGGPTMTWSMWVAVVVVVISLTGLVSYVWDTLRGPPHPPL
jgi:hypothetical protein